MAPSPPEPAPELPESLRALVARSVPKRFRKGALVIREGERGDAIYIIVSGRLRVFARSERDREITYGSYGPGEYVGEMSLDGGRRSASVEAEEETQCAMVTRQTLLAHIAARPEFALELLAKVIRRARAATLRARELALNDVYGRLVGWIDQHAVRGGDGARRIAEPGSHKAIAAQIGSSREMVSRLLKDLERGGYLRHEEGGWWLAGTLPARW